MKRHLIIPDTQCRAGVDLSMVDWAREAVIHYKPDTVIVLGDWWDMPSLSTHDTPGGTKLEGRRYAEDIAVGNEAFERFSGKWRRGTRWWRPDCHFLFGNHEDRISRAVKSDARLEGTLSLDDCETPGFTRHAFLKPVWIDGIAYAHYFQNMLSSHAIGGSIDNRLNRIGDSFVQGHEQGFRYGNRDFPTGRTRHGLVCGSFYLHDEDYKGRQGNSHWRGIVVLNEVSEGDYDIMPLSMSYLRRTWG